jgi:hypothetical protein
VIIFQIAHGRCGVFFNPYIIHILIINLLPIMYRSWDSVVGIATGYVLDDQGVGARVPVGSRIFSSPRRPDGSGVHPMGTGGSFPAVKLPGPEADHLPPASAEIKKMSIYTSTLPYIFMA